MSMKSLLCSLLVPVSVLATAGSALAHGVETNYILSEENDLDIQVMYSTGEPFEDAPVVIYGPDDAQTPILEGKTDAEGRFRFEAETSAEVMGEWKMKIGELGHADILLVPVDENGIDINLVGRAVPESSPATSPHVTVGVAVVLAGMIAGALAIRQTPKT